MGIQTINQEDENMTTFKTLLKTTLTPIALCLTLAIATPVMAKKGHHQKHDDMRQILSELSLTDTQKQDIRQILKQTREDIGLFRSDAKSFNTELRSLVQSSEWDQAAVEGVITQRQALMQEKALQRATNKHQVWNLLTAAQQAEFVEQSETRKAERDEMRTEGNRKGKSRVQKLESLDLTEEQLSAVKAIRTAAKENGEEIGAKLKNFKQAERSLIQSADFNPEAWLVLNTEYQADFMALALLKSKSKFDIWKLLTPEQQAEAQQETKTNFKKGHKHLQW